MVQIFQPGSPETRRGNSVKVPSRARPPERPRGKRIEQRRTSGEVFRASPRLTHVTGPFAALAHTFEVHTNDPDLGKHLDSMFRDLRVADGERPATAYTLVSNAPAPWVYAISVNGEVRAKSEDPRYVLEFLLWHVNREAVERTPEKVILHASGVARDGIACVLAAESECGKTTLAAGLVRRGFDYITDEAVAICPSTLLVSPFPKALSIDRGSWSVLPDLEPDLIPILRRFPPEQWQVPATAIRHDTLAGLTTPRVVMTPCYKEGAETELSPLGRKDMLIRLAELTFDFGAEARRNLSVLRALVAGSLCYQLTVGDLDEACSLIERAMQRVSSCGAQ
jgi:hypothetical protein